MRKRPSTVRQITMERFAEDANLVQSLRESKVVGGKEDEDKKFVDHFNYAGSRALFPSAALALMRRRQDGAIGVILRFNSEPDKPKCDRLHRPAKAASAPRSGSRRDHPADA